MERAPDRGRAWRERLMPVLEELGHVGFNPCEEELLVATVEERARFREWKASGHDAFLPLMRRIIDHDLKALQTADYVVCYWDEHAQQSGGTPAEVTLARVWGKPVYLVRAIDRSEVSSWVQGCASRAFDSLEDLFMYLRQEYGPR
jgi:nucleoside 2-deoxyribosyltransferase